MGNILRQCCRATVTNSVFFHHTFFLEAHCSAVIIWNLSYFHSAEGHTVHGCLCCIYCNELLLFDQNCVIATNQTRQFCFKPCGQHPNSFSQITVKCRFIIARWMRAINCTNQWKLMGNIPFFTCAFASEIYLEQQNVPTLNVSDSPCRTKVA